MITQLRIFFFLFNMSGLEILAFPCNQFLRKEPGTSQEAQEIACSRYKAEYPIFGKVLIMMLLVCISLWILYLYEYYNAFFCRKDQYSGWLKLKFVYFTKNKNIFNSFLQKNIYLIHVTKNYKMNTKTMISWFDFFHWMQLDPDVKVH